MKTPRELTPEEVEAFKNLLLMSGRPTETSGQKKMDKIILTLIATMYEEREVLNEQLDERGRAIIKAQASLTRVLEAAKAIIDSIEEDGNGYRYIDDQVVIAKFKAVCDKEKEG